MFVAVAQNGYTSYSYDGITWISSTLVGEWTSVAYGNNMFVALAKHYTSYSNDGINWSVPSVLSGQWMSVANGNNMLIAVANGYTSYSNDGINWISSTLSGQ